MRVAFNQSFDSRVVNFTLTYRFGKPSNAPQRKENPNEEQGRVSGSRLS